MSQVAPTRQPGQPHGDLGRNREPCRELDRGTRPVWQESGWKWHATARGVR